MTTPRPWLPLLSLLLQALLIGLASVLIDSSGLERAPGSWSHVFVFVVVTMLYAVWPLLLTLGAAVVAAAARTATVTRRAALTGAGVAGVFGAVGVAAGVLQVTGGAYASEVVFGLAVLLASLVPLAAALPVAARVRSSLTAARG